MADALGNPHAERFARQTALAELGGGGQAGLARSHALVVGCGALGGSAAQWLARAGVGRLTLIDRDVVEVSNLPRQVLFSDADARAGRPKAVAAADALRAAAPEDTTLEPVVAHADHRLLTRLFGRNRDRPGVIVDGTDNFQTRYLLNDAAVRWRTPYVYAGVVGGRGTGWTVLPGRTACVRCVAPEPPAGAGVETCETVGVFGPAVGVTASWQAGEALLVLAGRAELAGRGLLDADVFAGRVRTLAAPGSDPGCPCCGEGVFEWLDGSRSAPAVELCGSDAVQLVPPAGQRTDLGAVARALGPGARSTEHLVRSELAEPVGAELTVFADGRAVVRGVGDADRARAVVSRYLGW